MVQAWNLVVDQLRRHIGVVLYLVFGGLTTLVNIAAYWVCARALTLDTLTSTIIAWILAVLFAYVTNRTWVFGSYAHGIGQILLEAFAFFSCRLTTGLADLGMMWFFVVVLDFNDMLVKVAANVMVIVMNYLASKFIIFRKSLKRIPLKEKDKTL